MDKKKNNTLWYLIGGIVIGIIVSLIVFPYFNNLSKQCDDLWSCRDVGSTNEYNKWVDFDESNTNEQLIRISENTCRENFEKDLGMGYDDIKHECELELVRWYTDGVEGINDGYECVCYY